MNVCYEISSICLLYNELFLVVFVPFLNRQHNRIKLFRKLTVNCISIFSCFFKGTAIEYSRAVLYMTANSNFVQFGHT